MSKIPGFRSGKKWKKLIATIIYLFIIFVVYAIATTDTKPTTAPVAVMTQADKEALKSEAQAIPYKDLARNPDNYIGKKVKFTGKVVQVQESGNRISLRVNTTKTEYGYEDTIYVNYTKKTEEGRILEDDIITLWGECGKLFTYKTVLGSELSIPQVNASIIEVSK